MYCRSSLVQLILCAAVLLALFASPAHGAEGIVASVAIVIPLTEAVPTEWLESGEFGKCVSYGGLMDFGKKAAGHLIKWMQDTQAQNERFEIPENFLQNVRVETTLDNASNLRVSFYGTDESAIFVYQLMYNHGIRTDEYEDLHNIVQLEFETHCAKGSPVVPPVHDPTTVFPSAFSVKGLFFRLYYYPATCSNGKRDGDETDVDCGGVDCPPCSLSRSCAVNEDCAFGYECSSSAVCKSTVAPSSNTAVGSASIVVVMMISLAMMTLMWGVVM